MRILVTNDDGIRAEGLRHIVEVAKQFGEVKIAAPDRERSACAHAMTIREPLRANPVSWPGCEAWEISGFPVDCVNVGLMIGYPDGCDLVLSGINHGPNLGYDITYSGTAAGAMEGIINGIPSIAMSMALLQAGQSLNFETGARWFRENFERLINAPRADLAFLNVNVPTVPFEELKGTRVTTMGRRVYVERMEMREDPWDRPYYWQGGAVVNVGDQPGTDVEAVANGYVSVTPVSMDWTNRDDVARIREQLID